MTVDNIKTTGNNTNKERNTMKTIREIMKEIKEEFPELSPEKIKELAKEKWEVQIAKEEINNTKKNENIKKEEIKNETSTISEMDQFMEFMWKELSTRTVVTTKVASTLIYKFADKYGKEVEEVAKYTTAFVDYFVSDEGYKNTKRVGKDILYLVGLQIGKSLVSDFDVLVDAAEIAESVIEVKTALDTGRAIIGAHRYAKKHKDAVIQDILDYGNNQKAINMAYAALDEIMEEEE